MSILSRRTTQAVVPFEKPSNPDFGLIVFKRPLPGRIQNVQPQLAIRADLFPFSRTGTHRKMHKMVVPAPNEQPGFSGHSGMNGVPPQKIAEYTIIGIGG